MKRALSLLVMLTLAGCSSADPQASPTVAAPSPTPDIPRCYNTDPGVTSTWVPDERTGTRVVRMGQGPKGVILAPQSNGDSCQWRREALRLSKAGYHVASFSFAGKETDSLPAVAAELRKAGATSIVLIGASRGGTYALGQAAEVRAAGVISLSSVDKYVGYEAKPGLATYQGPVLFIAGDSDPTTPLAMTEGLIAAHPGPEEKKIFADSAHGTALVDGSYGEQTQPLIDAFLAKTLP